MTASEKTQLVDRRVGTNNAAMKTVVETTPGSEISAAQRKTLTTRRSMPPDCCPRAHASLITDY